MSKRDIEILIFSTKHPEGSSQWIEITFDLSIAGTDFARKCQVNEFEKYIQEVQQWNIYDVEISDFEGNSVTWNWSKYLSEIIKVDLTKYMQIKYIHTGKYEIILDPPPIKYIPPKPFTAKRSLLQIFLTWIKGFNN